MPAGAPPRGAGLSMPARATPQGREAAHACPGNHPGARGTARPTVDGLHVATAPKGQLLSNPDHRPAAG